MTRAELVRTRSRSKATSRSADIPSGHALHNGGISGVITREVFERGQSGAMLPYDPKRDEVILIRQFPRRRLCRGRHPWLWEAIAGMIEKDETARP
jgi:ADP-ribose pyrophosphatase